MDVKQISIKTHNDVSFCYYCYESLTHVGEANGRCRRQTRSFGQPVFFKSIGEPVQVIFTLPGQTQPEVNLYLGLNCPASRAKAFLARDLEEAHQRRAWSSMMRGISLIKHWF